MQYILMLYSEEGGWSRLSRTEREQAMAAYGAFNEDLGRRGILKGVNRLQPSSTATRVRVTNGKSQVIDGPYAESKEQLGGYYVIDVPNLDEALACAARCPAASHGIVEVRPLWVA
ncbi:MAG TPA: YciI family protein [Candidatus Binataceae bacterium]|nr:YciI family protein [Candidatus Binataceae bacterium]